MFQRGPYWTDFGAIWYRGLFWKSVAKIHICLKSGKHIGKFIGRLSFIAVGEINGMVSGCYDIRGRVMVTWTLKSVTTLPILVCLIGVMQSYGVACCSVIPYPDTKIINKKWPVFIEALLIVFNQFTSYFTFYTHNSVVGSLCACNIGAGTCSRVLRQLEVSSHKNCILLVIRFCMYHHFALISTWFMSVAILKPRKHARAAAH